jgi:hypothetical protein
MTPRSALLVVAALLSALASADAGAQTIYRCGNEYTRVPCANGKALEAGDGRSAAQRAEARRNTYSDKRLAAEMERDRRREEAAHPPAAAGSLSPASAAAPADAVSAPKKPAKKKSKRRPVLIASDSDFIAGVPGSEKKKTASR